MKFNEKHSNEINEFIMRYNEDEEFKNSVQELYNNNIYKLSILQIYALEEILRYGTKEVFNKFLETKGAYSDDEAVDLYDGFIKLLNEDVSFKQYKMQQLKKSPKTLSELEMFAFKLIGGSDDKKEQMYKEMTDELEYDPYNPILYSNDSQIRETLKNLFFGEFIHELLELPEMEPVKVRQKEKGRIANIDKPLMIEQIQRFISVPNSMYQLKQVIDNRFIKVKYDLLLGKGESAFEQYLKFNTNISSNEILDMEKDDVATNWTDYFMKMFNERKGQNEEQGKKFNTNVSSNESSGIEKDTLATDMVNYFMNTYNDKKEQNGGQRKK